MWRTTFCASYCCFLALAGSAHAQDSQTSDSGSGSASTTKPADWHPAYEPYILEDGGVSIEPLFWLNRAQPSIQAGASATEFGGIGYPGSARDSWGGEISMPAGHSDTLRFSYFRTQGSGNSYFPQDGSLFGESYNAGDYLVANYLIEDFKLSWDFLGYSWPKARGGTLRMKTLYEAQFVTAGMNSGAPYKAVTTNSSTGSTDYNTASGTKNLILPTLGLEFEQKVGRHLRWEAKASGFGLVHHGNLWDAEGSVAYRNGQFELLAGEKAFHFETSPQGNEYFVDTLSGPYVGIRYYLGGGTE